MWWLRACPKCGGDLFEDTNERPAVIKCFQCSRALPDGKVAVVKAGMRWDQSLRQTDVAERAA